MAACWADEGGMASSGLNADASGTTPAPAVTPAFRKLRRFNTGTPNVIQKSLLAVLSFASTNECRCARHGGIAHPTDGRARRDFYGYSEVIQSRTSGDVLQRFGLIVGILIVAIQGPKLYRRAGCVLVFVP